MNEFELGRILREMYDSASTGGKVTQIHLFGIKYADIIRDNHISIAEIEKASGLEHPSYVTEINKGINLSQYVIVK